MKQGNGNGSGALALHVAPELVEAIADAVVARLAQQDTPRQSPWLTVDEASEYLKCSRQAIYDRVSQGALQPARDGRRLLFHREHHLDAYLNGVTA